MFSIEEGERSLMSWCTTRGLLEEAAVRIACCQRFPDCCWGKWFKDESNL